jgi:hypothetical protein
MEAVIMTVKQIAVASAAVITLAAVAIPDQAEARWRGYGWRAPVAAGAVVGGLALGAAIASRPYYGGYGYGYAGPYNGGYAYGNPYVYYGGVGPYDYEYNSSYTYQPAYRYNNNYNSPYRNWTEF